MAPLTGPFASQNHFNEKKSNMKILSYKYVLFFIWSCFSDEKNPKSKACGCICVCVYIFCHRAAFRVRNQKLLVILIKDTLFFCAGCFTAKMWMWRNIYLSFFIKISEKKKKLRINSNITQKGRKFDQLLLSFIYCKFKLHRQSWNARILVYFLGGRSRLEAKPWQRLYPNTPHIFQGGKFSL